MSIYFKAVTTKNMYTIAKAICLIITYGLSCEVIAADKTSSIVSSITRLQVRHTVDTKDITSLTFSSFLQDKNKNYLLGIVDYQIDQRNDSENGRLEVDSGGPLLDSPLGWVVRGRLYYHENTALAAGVQLNLNELPELGPWLKKNKITSFLQVLGGTNDLYSSDFEVLHYYNLDIVHKRLALRGYNIFWDDTKYGLVRNSWSDLIYSINPKLDTYYRVDYVSHDNNYLGQRGTTQYLGIRINWY